MTCRIFSGFHISCCFSITATSVILAIVHAKKLPLLGLTQHNLSSRRRSRSYWPFPKTNDLLGYIWQDSPSAASLCVPCGPTSMAKGPQKDDLLEKNLAVAVVLANVATVIYIVRNHFFSTISKFDAMVRSAIAKIGQNRTRVNLNNFSPSLRLSSFYSHYVGFRTSPQQLVHYDIGIHCSRQFSHVGSLFISSSVSCFVNCPHASYAHLSCSFVSQPNETVHKVDEEGRVRRWVTCSYASCF